jgi:hypothetical protein
MSKPAIVPKTTRAEALKQAAIKKRQEEKKGIDLLPTCMHLSNTQQMQISFLLEGLRLVERLSPKEMIFFKEMRSPVNSHHPHPLIAHSPIPLQVTSAALFKHLTTTMEFSMICNH